MKPIVVDFETEAIQDRPTYPPKPVGVAILVPGKKAQYLAWGHPTKNNATAEKAGEVLRDIWRGERELLFHNAKFDLDVAFAHFGLVLPAWQRVHDTMYTLFLKDPHSPALSLKPAAEHWLGLPPEEQDAVADWLRAQKIISKAQKPGAFISKAPGDIVGRYAIGDVERTLKLHDLLYPQIVKAGMKGAYDRERQLMPLLLENERHGVRVDTQALEKDLRKYEAALELADRWLRKALKNKDLNLDADADVAEALKAAGVVTDFVKTKTGRDSVAKKNLTIDKFNDQKIASALGYRNRLSTVLSMSMRPWLEQATANKGFIFTRWNQVRSGHGVDTDGARSGRLSCSRLMNITKDFNDKGDGYQHPKHIEVPPLPLVRKYVVPDKGAIFGHRDYNQQEFRILAHYEDDVLRESYVKNPRIDYHDNMQGLIKNIAKLELARRAVKILNFGINYGMGIGKLAMGLGVDTSTARTLRDAQKKAVPGVAALDLELKRRGKAGEPLRTWGGRLYYCEQPREIASGPRKGQVQTFEYKLLNYLIQGSAADCTKQAVIDYHAAAKDGRFLVTVHDEINISVPEGKLKSEMKILREVMEAQKFDVPMLTDAKTGPSWGELKKYEE